VVVIVDNVVLAWRLVLIAIFAWLLSKWLFKLERLLITLDFDSGCFYQSFVVLFAQVAFVKKVLNDLFGVLTSLWRFNRLLKFLLDLKISFVSFIQMLLQVPQCPWELVLIDNLLLYASRWRYVSLHLCPKSQLKPIDLIRRILGGLCLDDLAGPILIDRFVVPLARAAGSHVLLTRQGKWADFIVLLSLLLLGAVQCFRD